MKTQNGKLDRHQELAFELKPIYQASKVSIIPIGKISKDTKTLQETLGNSNIFGRTQLSAIHGTAHVLRKTFCV